MTLALLVIAALCQAGLARRSLHAAMAANEAQTSLQRHWGAASCRDFLLNQAESIFISLEEARPEKRRRWPAPSRAGASFQLGGLDVECVLADEDAKLNLNSIYARKPADVRRIITDQVGVALLPELRPDLSQAAKLRKRWFGSWGNVFAIPVLLSSPNGWLKLLTGAENLTCWGNGKPNIRRASDQTLELMATQVAGGAIARKFVEARRDCKDDLLLADLLESLDLRRTDQLKLRSVFSDRSNCYSLSLALRDSRRRWYHLWIKGDPAASSPGGIQSYSW